MAGHSKWANIQHRKGKQDKLRSKMFSKLAKEITVAAKMGDPDPDKNPRLRLAVKAAKAASVPKDVIDRAIRKSQVGDAEDYTEIRYEGYGPNGIAIIVETMTDNLNRTASNVRDDGSAGGRGRRRGVRRGRPLDLLRRHRAGGSERGAGDGAGRKHRVQVDLEAADPDGC